MAKDPAVKKDKHRLDIPEGRERKQKRQRMRREEGNEETQTRNLSRGDQCSSENMR